MMNDLYLKRNERKVSFLYPKNGNKNILRQVNGVKDSFLHRQERSRDYRQRG